MLRITFILDVSGSMAALRDETISGVNRFIDKQREVEGEATMTLVLFSHRYSKVYTNMALTEVPYLTRDDYAPDGWTALFDAVGMTLQAMPVAEPSLLGKLGVKDAERHIVVVYTDGAENASKNHSMQRVRELIEEREKAGWQFVFMGANQDAWQQASGMGFQFSNTLNVAANAGGTKEMYRSLGEKVATSRHILRNAPEDQVAYAASLNWTAEERKKQEDAGAVKTSSAVGGVDTSKP